MHPDQPRPSKPDLIVELLTELSRELRNAVQGVAVQTIKLQKLSRENAKTGGREPEVVAACNDRLEVLKRFHEIWDRARKPIINLGMTSSYGEKLLAEFRCLSLRPNALEVLKFVGFLEVVLDREKVRTSGASRQERRRQIVDTLQAKLDQKSREALAKQLRIDDSAIRAAIRGDLDHSGPAAEERLLEACRTHDVDVHGWPTD